ncbi:MAG: HAMP domain-containing histidine kinase [Alphaproteobacteria bacterium]|nr:HAMP domain-containing histidine kinase [Alphaproteobacteria bacterium]
MARRLRTIALILGLVVAVLITAGTFAYAYRGEAQTVSLRANLLANRLSRYVYVHGDHWRYTQARIADLLSEDEALAQGHAVVIRDRDGREILTLGAMPAWPALRVQREFAVRARTVGSVELRENINDVLASTVVAAMLGALLGFLTTLAVDVLPMRLIRRALAALEERTASQVAAEDARAEAERANRAKSAFLSNMSHELRTPLNAILGFAQLLEMGIGGPKLADSQRGYVRDIMTAGSHLRLLVDEVLDLARIESGAIQARRELVALAPAIAECIALVEPDAKARAIAIAAEPDLGSAVVADGHRLRQVVVNLLSNAVKYNRDGGEIRLTVAPADGEALRLTVADTGPGIAREKQAALFQPFSRLGAERTAIPGTGIGLALAKRYVEAMGGRIGVDSDEGTGARFWIELPRAPAPA